MNGMNSRNAVGGYRIAPSPITNGPLSCERQVRRAGIEQALGRLDVPAVVEPEGRVRQVRRDREADPQPAETDQREHDDTRGGGEPA